jgi:hypothetical protein
VTIIDQTQIRAEVYEAAKDSPAVISLFKCWDSCFEDWRIDGYQIVNEGTDRGEKWKDLEIKTKILKLNCSGRVEGVSTHWAQVLTFE